MAATCLQHNWTFIHVPKTGGTTIHSMLDTIGAAYVDNDHASITELRTLFPDLPRDHRWWCMCRNPYDRIVSGWFDCKLALRVGADQIGHTFEEFVLTKLGEANWPHFVPQVHFIQSPQDENITIGRFEDFRHELQVIAVTFGFTWPAVWPHRRKSRMTERPTLTPAMVEKINHFYAADFRRFGYPVLHL